jgi:hypothetical protein
MIELGYRENGEIAVLKLKRPPVNAFTSEGLLQFEQIINFESGYELYSTARSRPACGNSGGNLMESRQ